VPTIFPTYPAHKQPAPVKHRKPHMKICAPSTSENQEKDDTLHYASSLKAQKLDHNYCFWSIEQHLQKTQEALAKANSDLKHQRKRVQAMSRVLKRRNNKIASLLNELEERHIISQSQRDLLKMNFGAETFTIIENELKLKNKAAKSARYSEELKSFAVSLHFYSAQAYECVRTYLHLSHPSRIRQWAQSINCNPGSVGSIN
jgi:septal ring factor EnvC (AmiA/AmiB activator)